METTGSYFPPVICIASTSAAQLISRFSNRKYKRRPVNFLRSKKAILDEVRFTNVTFDDDEQLIKSTL
ncbi:hypothetical protein TNCV_2861941 [Trichonephila clavipes]|nr:hypothetical protein TNCV_2861941 [Trichonephila clavipes]